MSEQTKESNVEEWGAFLCPGVKAMKREMIEEWRKERDSLWECADRRRAEIHGLKSRLAMIALHTRLDEPLLKQRDEACKERDSWRETAGTLLTQRDEALTKLNGVFHEGWKKGKEHNVLLNERNLLVREREDYLKEIRDLKCRLNEEKQIRDELVFEKDKLHAVIHELETHLILVEVQKNELKNE